MAARGRILLLIALSTVSCLAAKRDVQAALTATLDIEHSFDSQTFTKRGTVSVQSLRSPQNVKFEQTPLTEEEASKLQVSARDSSNYHIRVHTRFSTPDQTEDQTDGSEYVYGFTKACLLIESKLADHITIHTDGTGNVIGVSMTTPAAQCSGHYKHVPTSFTSTVQVQGSEPGASPDVEGFQQKLAEKKEAESQQDNRSFLQKYWMYILIGALALMMVNSAGQASQSGGAAS